MKAYHALSGSYDRLTQDIPYSSFAEYYSSVFHQDPEPVRVLLDLCCGTGSLTREMSLRGFELVSVDQSAEMLSVAQIKCSDLHVSPLFICQNASRLDLFGTVDGGFSSLDSINYIPPTEIKELFRRLFLFIRPGGFFIFDLKTPEWMESISGFTSVDEDDDMLCIWRSDFDSGSGCLVHGIDLFTRQNGAVWSRDTEEHIEYAYKKDDLVRLIEETGFLLEEYLPVTSFGGDGRVFYVIRRKSSG